MFHYQVSLFFSIDVIRDRLESPQNIQDVAIVKLYEWLGYGRAVSQRNPLWGLASVMPSLMRR